MVGAFIYTDSMRSALTAVARFVLAGPARTRNTMEFIGTGVLVVFGWEASV
jgi:hypothetical protein